MGFRWASAVSGDAILIIVRISSPFKSSQSNHYPTRFSNHLSGPSVPLTPLQKKPPEFSNSLTSEFNFGLCYKKCKLAIFCTCAIGVAPSSGPLAAKITTRSCWSLLSCSNSSASSMRRFSSVFASSITCALEQPQRFELMPHV